MKRHYISAIYLLLAGTLLNTAAASEWADISFGEIPLSKDLVMSGKLSRSKLILGKDKAIPIEVTLFKDKLEENELQDPYYVGRNRITFKINELVCQAITILTTEDELGAKIKYGMILSYDKNSRSTGCPTQVQFSFGQMSENISQSVYTEIWLKTENSTKWQVYKGNLTKN